MGCELGQGYHFAHPMEPADLQRAISGGAWPAAEEAAPGRAAAVLQIREASA
jgi:predicted signal transduction protein with EAL and GGDEF domain